MVPRAEGSCVPRGVGLGWGPLAPSRCSHPSWNAAGRGFGGAWPMAGETGWDGSADTMFSMLKPLRLVGRCPFMLVPIISMTPSGSHFTSSGDLAPGITKLKCLRAALLFFLLGGKKKTSMWALSQLVATVALPGLVGGGAWSAVATSPLS